MRTLLLIGVLLAQLPAAPTRLRLEGREVDTPVAAAVRAADHHTASGTSLTKSFTIAGAGEVLYVFLVHSPGDTDVTGVSFTYSGDALSTKFTNTSFGNRHLGVFRLINPDVGTANLVGTWSGGSQFSIVIVAVTGADQTTPDDAEATTDGSGGGTSGNVVVTGGATGDLVLAAMVNNNGITGVTPGDTVVDSETSIANGLWVTSQVGAASVTMDWSWNEFTAYGMFGFNVNAAGAAAGNRRRRVLIGGHQ